MTGDENDVYSPIALMRALLVQTWRPAVCGAASFPDQRRELLTLVAAQSHKIFLYENFLRSMFASVVRVATKANHQILSN
jgi:hypothetical protein